MFCPSCGIDEKQPNQYCRACGANLMMVRDAIGQTDSVTASAITAREEIGRAVAAKIREAQSVYELKEIAEDVLPEIEKFLESPEEKRLRRIRTGTLIAFIGLGIAVSLSIVALAAGRERFLLLAGMGGITFFIGLAFIVNGYLLTTTTKTIADNADIGERQRALDASTGGLHLSAPQQPFRSVTEATTTHLKEKHPVPRN